MGIKHYYHTTPVKMRKIGDTILFATTSLSGLAMGAPLSESTRNWVLLSLQAIGVGGKIITNLFKEEAGPAQAGDQASSK